MAPLEYRLNHWGLGTIISTLSMLFSANRLIRLHVSNNCNILDNLKSYLNIPDSQLIIVHDTEDVEDISNSLSDQGKYFSPYFNVNHIQVFGQTLPTQKRNKPCIGFALYARPDPGENLNNEHPHNRYYSPEVYADIFQLIIAAGYDVITLNSGFNFEHKIFMMNELCDAIIGYEGGMAHLAHLLKIPSIILPYHHDGKRALYQPDGQVDIDLLYATHKLHIDRRTYFLNSSEEIINWSPAQLRQTINNLHNQQGNNILLSGKISVESDPLRVFFKEPNGCNSLDPFLTQFEKNFIKTHIHDLKFQ